MHIRCRICAHSRARKRGIEERASAEMPGLFVLSADMKSKSRTIIILVNLIVLIGALAGVYLVYRAGVGNAEQAERDALALLIKARDEYYRGIYDACRYAGAPIAICLDFIANAAQSGWDEQGSPGYKSPPPREQTASP